MKHLYYRIVASGLLLCLTLFHSNAADLTFSRTTYLDLMETAVGAYTDAQVEDYISRIEKVGITEHGYPRLVANIGILVSNGRMPEKKDLFIRMMDICVREMPTAYQRNKKLGSVGNDFAVKEIVCTILEAEKSGLFPKSMTDAWRNALKDMKADDIYKVRPKPGSSTAHNWCVFGALSECARIYAGIGGEQSYADKYLSDQLRFFDENGMYRDPHEPIYYDFVTRLQYASTLYFGYDGPAREAIEENLLKSAQATLDMQSVTGEIPYGGRSNQFLHNEATYAALCEYYASWFKSRGDMKMASRFRAAASEAVRSLSYWTSQEGIRHIKNRYPVGCGYGCESYAYFDKYMVTLGSNAYMAFLFADDSIPVGKLSSTRSSVFVTSPVFHRIMVNKGGYTIQFDTNAQTSYDSNGLGRFQKAGAPPVLALSSPLPAGPKVSYRTDIPAQGPLSIGPVWEKYVLESATPGRVSLTDGMGRWWTSRLSSRGLKMTIGRYEGNADLMMTIPVLTFDGESSPEVSCDGCSIVIRFNGWQCRYSTNGTITDTGKDYANRNGRYRRYEVTRPGASKLTVTASIEKL